ncbi:MAG: bifunctional aminotransferase class I/II-fold pyridoxal phosphate-dependent enzyme/GNAT family N-acetyltransferase [Actinoplanes sp.]
MTAVFHYYRGRVALHAILRGLRTAAGDEVVVQAYTCAAVVEPLLRLGLTPVFVDVDRRTGLMDPEALPAAITSRTRAVIVQHTFGAPADLPRIAGICREANVPVVEDCAHVTEPDERGPVGRTGVAAFYSYEWGKPVIAGVGGTAVVHDPGLAAQMSAQYASYVPPPAAREALMAAQFLAHEAATRLGVTWRLRALYRRLAGMGLVVGSYAADPADSPEYRWRMTRTVRRRLPRRTAQARAALPARRATVEAYREALAPLGHDVPPAPIVPLRIPVAVGDKPRVLDAAQRLGVEAGDWFATPVHPLAGPALAAAGYREGSCPGAEWAAGHLITFPVRAAHAPVGRAIRLLAASDCTPDDENSVRVVCAPFTERQIRAMAEMHAAEVPNGFLTSFGVPALEMLYRHVARSRHCALFLAERGGEPVGYICGTRDTGALYREFLLRRWWQAGPVLLPRLLRPGRIFRAVETLRYPRTGTSRPRAEIVNFVVRPQARGQGAAPVLFGRLMRWFEALGEPAVAIVTGEQQHRAHGFYEKAGAVLDGHTSIHHGTSSRVYRYELSRTRVGA